MSNPKHTPGPWRTYPLDWRIIEAPDAGLVVAEMSGGGKDDARLIAEAPAMRQTLTDILNAVGDEFEITARHIAGVDSDGRIMLKGSFLELLVKGRALLARIDGDD